MKWFYTGVCDVEGCIERAMWVGIKDNERRAQLCDEHYRQLNKKKKLVNV